EPLVAYHGDGVVDEGDFEVFDAYFYGTWLDETGGDPIDLAFYDSGTTFSVGYYGLLDIYTEDDLACLAMLSAGVTAVYVVDTRSPETMLRYEEADYDGRERDKPDHVYTKAPAEEREDGFLGFFGIYRLICAERIPAEVLLGVELEPGDGRKWIAYGEGVTLLERTDDSLTLRTLCRAEGEEPFGQYIPDDPFKEIETSELIYTVRLNGDAWSIGECRYAE
ncbi:MAG: hypothetical protein NC237_11900, partial [Eubacterium sp.]|nr:hypothetical protein [Eubacterium sp.]